MKNVKFHKKGGGKAEGKGGGKAGGKARACYECASEVHIAGNCPVRAETVALGGPERLPKRNVEMGGQGGGKSFGKGPKGFGKGANSCGKG